MSDVPVRPVSDDEPVEVTFFTRCVACGREREWVEIRPADSVRLLVAELSPLDRGRFYLGRTLGCATCGFGAIGELHRPFVPEAALAGSPDPAPPVVGTAQGPEPCPFCGESLAILDVKRGAHCEVQEGDGQVTPVPTGPFRRSRGGDLTPPAFPE